MRTVITLPDQIHAQAKRRAADLGISFAEFARRLFEKELDTPTPQGDLDSIRGMVRGEGFDMADEGRRIVAEAFATQFDDGSG